MHFTVRLKPKVASLQPNGHLHQCNHHRIHHRWQMQPKMSVQRQLTLTVRGPELARFESPVEIPVCLAVCQLTLDSHKEKRK